MAEEKPPAASLADGVYTAQDMGASAVILLCEHFEVKDGKIVSARVSESMKYRVLESALPDGTRRVWLESSPQMQREGGTAGWSNAESIPAEKLSFKRPDA